MKKIIQLILCICMIITTALSIKAFATVKHMAIYVAPNGNDSNTGTEASPLGTIKGARDKIRKTKETSGLPAKGITVYFRGGNYKVTETTSFTEEDSGTVDAPIIYRAYKEEIPIFTGGRYISGKDFIKVTNTEKLSRLSTEDAKKNILCYNLFENGFTYNDLDFNKDFWTNGWLNAFADGGYFENIPRRLQVYIDDEALYLARYPNKTNGAFKENPYDVYLKIPAIDESDNAALPIRGVGGGMVFKTTEGRIKTWSNYDDIIIFGMPGYDFQYEKIVAENINPDNMTIELRADPTEGIRSGSRYGFENVYEELDAPGEYFIDKNTGMLYIYPNKDMNTSQVKISTLDENLMVECINTSFVTFSGLTFELTKGSVFNIQGGRNCTIDTCIIKNFSGKGVKLGDAAHSTRDFIAKYDKDFGLEHFINEFPAKSNGYNHKVVNSTFLNTGFSACVIQSGNVANRESGGMVFENNLVKHSGLLGSTYQSGINLSGVGITVKNNEFFYCKGQAIFADIIDTEIIYNEFCDSPSDMSEDTGAIYLNYLDINDGVKIRYNYFHDITDIDARIGMGWFGYSARTAVYYDTNTPFRDFSYNVVYNVPRVQNIEVISPTTSINNVFIDCNEAMVQMESICEAYKGYTAKELLEGIDTDYRGPITIVADIYKKGIYSTPIWKDKYPEMHEYISYLENEKSDLTKPMDQIYNNLFININKPQVNEEMRLPAKIIVDPKYGKIENNIYLDYDPGFINYKGKDFQLPKNITDKYNIEQIDMKLIGRQEKKN